MFNFDERIERRGTNCAKWDGMALPFGRDDLLPLWIADMDFAVPPCVAEAVQKRAAHPIYGYARPSKTYAATFCAWLKKRHGWDAKEEWVCHSPGVVSAVAMAVLAFTAPGDAVMITPPVYHPFRLTLEAQGRKVANCPMILKDGRFELDFDVMETQAKEARMLILCNPQNPTGRVFTKEELERVEKIARENDLIVVSDEIHSDIVYKGHKHLPFPTVSDWAKNHSLCLMAPSKTFNIAGLATSTILIPNDKLRYHWQRMIADGCHIGGGNVFGLIACEAAYRDGEPWLEELLTYLEGNVAFVEEELAKRVPEVKLIHPEGIYVPLVDFRALGLNGLELQSFLREKCGLAMNDGFTFGVEGEGFARLNIATPRANLETFIARLEKALH